MSATMSIVLYALAGLSAVLGIVVFLRNTKSGLHRLFLSVPLTNSLWVASNALYGSVADDNLDYIIALASYAFAAAMAFFFMCFAAEVSGRNLLRHQWLWWAGAIFIISAAWPNFLAERVVDQTIITTPFILIYAAGIALTFIVGVTTLIYGVLQQHGQRRQQVGAVFIGIVATSIGGMIFNLAFPLVGDYRFVQLGPAFSILLIIASAYAIVRHRLFDIRAAVVRVAAYALSVMSVAVLYAIVTYAVAVPLFGEVSIGANAQLLYLSLVVLVALTFQPIKNFFDRATRAVFYKNAYDTQHVLDKVGALLVREVEVVQLVRHSVRVLNDAIKAAGAEVVLLHDGMRIRDI